MRRLLCALRADIIFQMKQGFYLVYILISLMYMIVLSFLPSSILKIILPLVVYSDPSVLGLFFIGGIVMLEKLQGVISVIVITPLKIEEYLLSKLISLSLVSIFAGIGITLITYTESVNWLILIVGIVLTSSFFTLCGILISAKAKSVNHYLLKVIPIMLLLTLPCFSLLEFPYNEFFVVFPSVAALRLMLGAYFDISFLQGSLLISYLTFLNYITLKFTKKYFEKHVVFGGASE